MTPNKVNRNVSFLNSNKLASHAWKVSEVKFLNKGCKTRTRNRETVHAGEQIMMLNEKKGVRRRKQP